MTEQKESLVFIKDGKVILKAQAGFPDREIGEVREDEETTLQYFEDRFQHLESKVEDLQQQIEENDNKGSFLMKLLNLKEQLSSYDGIGEYQPLYDRLEGLEKMLNEYIRQNRARNLEVKTTLIEEAKSYAANPNWKEATEQLKELRQRWIRVGAVDDEHKESINDTFQKVYDDFYDRKKAFYEQKQQMIATRVAKYEELVERAKKIERGSEDARKLVEEWKALETIPKETYNKLFRVFKKLTSAPRPGQRKFQSRQPVVDEKALFEKKAQLLEQVKGLKEKEDVGHEVLNAIKAIQQEWKSLGRAGKEREKDQELNQEFYFLCDYFFEKNFLSILYNKKVHKELDEEAKLKFKLKLLKDLLFRDQKELTVFEENMEKFNMGTKRIDNLVDVKFEKQKRKVKVKQQLMDEIRASLKNL